MVKQSFDTERFEANLKLAQLGFDLWGGRRSFEWRLSFSLWALLAGVIATKEFVLPRCVIGLCAIGLLLIYAFLWLFPIWRSNARDKNLAKYYLGEAQALLGNATIQSRTQIPLNLRGFLSDWANQFQIIATALLLITVFALKGY